MSESKLIDDDVKPTEKVFESFFYPGVYDGRFNSVETHVFHHHDAIENDPLVFQLPSIRSNAIYQIQKTCMVVDFLVRKKGTDTVPADGKEVLLANNCLNVRRSSLEHAMQQSKTFICFLGTVGQG